jgi:hypothetical protein
MWANASARLSKRLWAVCCPQPRHLHSRPCERRTGRHPGFSVARLSDQGHGPGAYRVLLWPYSSGALRTTFTRQDRRVGRTAKGRRAAADSRAATADPPSCTSQAQEGRTRPPHVAGSSGHSFAAQERHLPGSTRCNCRREWRRLSRGPPPANLVGRDGLAPTRADRSRRNAQDQLVAAPSSGHRVAARQRVDLLAEQLSAKLSHEED